MATGINVGEVMIVYINRKITTTTLVAGNFSKGSRRFCMLGRSSHSLHSPAGGDNMSGKCTFTVRFA